MRRKDKQVTREDALEFLGEMSHGVLATQTDDGWPHLKPVNFAHHANALYFHGARKGEKVDDLKQETRASFIVLREFDLIPSTFMNSEQACPATSYYKSVYLRGSVVMVDDLAERGEALALFMKKLQPEGGYRQICPHDPEYRQELKRTQVFRFDIEDMTVKFNFGQNLDDQTRQFLRSSLKKRNTPDDREVLTMMERYRPAKTKRDTRK